MRACAKRASCVAFAPLTLASYISGGVGELNSLHANKKCFDKMWLVPRVLRDVSRRSTRCSFLGLTSSMPMYELSVPLAHRSAR